MTFAERFAGFVDSDGLVTPTQHSGLTPNGSGNGVLYTSLAMIALVERILASEYDATHYRILMSQCVKEPGLLTRGPHQPDQQAFDDYMGYAAAMCRIDSSSAAKRIVRYGENNYFRPFWPLKLSYYYNNIDAPSSHFPDGRLNSNAWLGRYPAFRGFMKVCAGLPVSFLEQCGMAVALWSSARAPITNQDAWLMGWLIFSTRSASVNPVLSLARRVWASKFQQVHGGSVRSIMSRIFCAEHPVLQLFD